MRTQDWGLPLGPQNLGESETGSECPNPATNGGTAGKPDTAPTNKISPLATSWAAGPRAWPTTGEWGPPAVHHDGARSE